MAQDEDGTASGVAITSARQPLVDDLTVRQTGAIAYALSGLVNERIEAEQQQVFDDLLTRSKEDLDRAGPARGGHGHRRPTPDRPYPDARAEQGGPPR